MLENIKTMFATETSLSLTLAFFTAVIVIYSIFVFYFYRFLANKNIIELNLNQYNQYSNPALVKIFAAFLYIIEYLILLPILTFFWFSVLSILILILAKGLPVPTVLLISAALVTAVRITSYVNEDLAKDLAKMVPFTLLAIAITTAGFFDMSIFFYRLAEIPQLFSNIPYYLLFIVGIELIMRIGEFIYDTFHSTKAEEN
ncbi:hypothetical protein HN903_01490 [archaeon]|jgi:hypothetical protein|nr:hypothetical protein [archaeon]MBT7128405.1 hypothetical protein [archaeon]